MLAFRYLSVAVACCQTALAAAFAPSIGAVASLNANCSEIGLSFMKKGGTAADAMVATQICVGVVGMHLTGIGGGGFMLVRSSNGTYDFIDFRESAPAAAFQDMYKANVNLSIFGGLASGVPGELRGLENMHDKYGKLMWGDLFAPSIQLARYGFPVSGNLDTVIKSLGNESFLQTDPAWAIDFAPNGTVVKEGDIMTRKRYADLLETISMQGADVFYVGAIANATITALQKTNGTMTLEDLKNYTVAIREPFSVTYRGFRITSGGAPCSGIVALNVMKTIEGYTDIGQADALNLSTHRLDEAIRFGYGARAELGDPLFVEGLDEYQQRMIAENTTAEIRTKISDTHTLSTSAYDPAGLESLETPGTSHAVTADASGMTVSLTSTVNLYFGSQVIVPETGLILNNEMNDFSIPGASNAFGYIPSPANYVRPGKRPLSSISPVIVEFLSNKTHYFTTGAAGGSRIITSTIQSLWHILDQNMTTAEALAAPRFHDQLSPNQIQFEYSYNNETTAFMKALGHNVTWIPSAQSDVQALRRLPNGTFEAAAEPREVGSGAAVG